MFKVLNLLLLFMLLLFLPLKLLLQVRVCAAGLLLVLRMLLLWQVRATPILRQLCFCSTCARFRLLLLLLVGADLLFCRHHQGPQLVFRQRLLRHLPALGARSLRGARSSDLPQAAILLMLLLSLTWPKLQFAQHVSQLLALLHQSLEPVLKRGRLQLLGLLVVL